jgi:hypothetical protein
VKVLIQRSHGKPVLMGSGLAFLSAGAWVGLGLWAGLVAIGLSLLLLDAVSD